VSLSKTLKLKSGSIQSHIRMKETPEQAPKLKIYMEMQYSHPSYKVAIFELMELKDVTFQSIKDVVLKCKNELESYDRREE